MADELAVHACPCCVLLGTYVTHYSDNALTVDIEPAEPSPKSASFSVRSPDSSRKTPKGSTRSRETGGSGSSLRRSASFSPSSRSPKMQDKALAVRQAKARALQQQGNEGKALSVRALTSYLLQAAAEIGSDLPPPNCPSSIIYYTK